MAGDPGPELMAQFCREVVPGILVECCGVPASDAGLVAQDILFRAEAAARLDRDACEILAAPFFEESFNHDPDGAPTWLKAITTLAIRNSRLEDLHVNGPVKSGGIKVLTTYGLAPLSHLISARRRDLLPAEPGRDDPFGRLADVFPRAWSCLATLRTALTSGGGRFGYRIPDGPLPDLPDETEIIEARSADNAGTISSSFPSVVFSAIDPRFDRQTIQFLQMADGDGFTLGLASLSRISRNSHKLLRVLEFLLARQARILTTNCLLTGQEVWVRRHELVQPDSLNPMPGFQNMTGISGSHRKTLESYLYQVSQLER